MSNPDSKSRSEKCSIEAIYEKSAKCNSSLVDLLSFWVFISLPLSLYLFPNLFASFKLIQIGYNIQET